jgi:hypothetical protein
MKRLLPVAFLAAWFAASVALAQLPSFEEVDLNGDGIVDGSATVTRFVSWFNGLFDNYVIDGLVNAVARDAVLTYDERAVQSADQHAVPHPRLKAS